MCFFTCVKTSSDTYSVCFLLIRSLTGLRRHRLLGRHPSAFYLSVSLDHDEAILQIRVQHRPADVVGPQHIQVPHLRLEGPGFTYPNSLPYSPQGKRMKVGIVLTRERIRINEHGPCLHEEGPGSGWCPPGSPRCLPG